MSQEVVIRITVPDGVKVDVDYAEVPPEPSYLAELPPITAPVAPTPPQAVPAPPAMSTDVTPQCPQHGAMTFHATKKDGTPMPRYSCDAKVGDKYCPTKPVWIKNAA